LNEEKQFERSIHGEMPMQDQKGKDNENDKSNQDDICVQS